MIINKLFIGNKTEAFIEDNFNSGLNIIFSYDNNKGKTLVSQGLFYAMGNDPVFPSSFEYKNYYFIVEIITSNSKNISICRKDNTFIVKNDGNFNIYESVSDFKRFFDKNISVLPIIIQDGKERKTDISLFLQLFFVGQDSRDTSKVFNSSFNNKEDFMDMLYSHMGCGYVPKSINLDEVKEKINRLKENKQLLLAENKILKKKSPAIQAITYTQDNEALIQKIEQLEKKNDEIVELKKDRNRAYNRKLKNENLLKELKSLNRGFSEGTIVCLDCNSNHIGYQSKNNDVSFDASDAEIRNQIFASIEERIEINKEEIEKISLELAEKQKDLSALMQEEQVSLENLLFYKEQLNSQTINADNTIQEIDKELKRFQNLLSAQTNKNEKNIEKQKDVLNKILKEMNAFYKKMDPKGNLKFEQLFTTKNQLYSGSEETEFYVSRLYAFAKIIQHEFPIVMDSFRGEEISTDKEEFIIEQFKNLKNQAILTATLKEAERDRYNKHTTINQLDYSSHETCQMLTSEYTDRFSAKMKDFLVYW